MFYLFCSRQSRLFSNDDFINRWNLYVYKMLKVLPLDFLLQNQEKIIYFDISISILKVTMIKKNADIYPQIFKINKGISKKINK